MVLLGGDVRLDLHEAELQFDLIGRRLVNLEGLAMPALGDQLADVEPGKANALPPKGVLYRRLVGRSEFGSWDGASIAI
jgi:hypothetical protein